MISRKLTTKKFGPFRWESSRGGASPDDFSHSANEKLLPSRQQCGSSESGPKVALRFLTFHQLLCDEWTAVSQDEPVARIKVDEKNCFGMIEWQAVRVAASRFLPKHTAAAAWKYQNLSRVEQQGLPPMPKDRGAEQGDVDGLFRVQPGFGNGGLVVHGRW